MRKTALLHAYSTRSPASGDFHLPKRNLNIGEASFSYHGAYIWNQLSVQIREAQHIKCFQNCLKETIENRLLFYLFYIITYLFIHLGYTFSEAFWYPKEFHPHSNSKIILLIFLYIF